MTKRTVTFTDNGQDVSVTIYIIDHDFWTFAKGYKVHYCEDYKQICVYRDGDNDYKTIYQEAI